VSRLPILKYRELAALMRSGGAVFVRQDGSHRVWTFRDIPYPVAAHDDGSDVARRTLADIRAKWGLRREDGVSDDDFMKGRWGKSRRGA
jgi:predicted RNA binding protein YcfA (HicA-like mRNA interferase family)